MKMSKTGLLGKLLIILIPLSVLAISLLITVSYFVTSQIVNQQIDETMSGKIDANSEYVQKLFLKHAAVAETLAKSVASSSKVLQKQQYIAMLTAFPQTNADTCGVGVWFQPYQWKAHTKLFGPYAYKKNGKVVYTDEYSDPKYNYLDQLWYKIGLKKELVAWSEPYVDPVTKVSMITATSPMYKNNGDILGVATADMDLSSLQKKISSLKVGRTGYAFLVDGTGTYIATNQSKDIMKQKIQKSSNKSLRDAGKQIVRAKKGVTSFTKNGSTYYLYYASVSGTPLHIGIAIDKSELYAPLHTLLNRMISAGVLFILVLSVVLFLAAHHFIRPLSTAVFQLDKIATGDLTQEIPKKLLTQTDETGRVTRSVETMKETLKNLIAQLQITMNAVTQNTDSLNEVAAQVHTSASGVSAAVHEIAKGSTEGALSLENIVQQTTEFTTSFSKTAGQAILIGTSSKKVIERAAEGKKHVSELVQSMQSFQEQFVQFDQKTNQLSQRIEEINGFVALINEISSQTHLLSLNAAIEAARAGEQGKGFAVVADEIGKLANQSGESSKYIQGTIASLLKENGILIEAMHQMQKEIESQSEKVEKAITSYHVITKNMETIAPEITEIGDSSKKFEQESRKILDHIQEISAITEQTSASTEEIAASIAENSTSIQKITGAAEELGIMTAKVSEQLAHFRLS